MRRGRTQLFVEMDAFFSEDILQLLLEPESSNLDLDALLLAALEDTHDTEAVPVPVVGAAETSHSHFLLLGGTQPVVLLSRKQARAEGIPAKTQQDTKYCVGVYIGGMEGTLEPNNCG